jgi:hypothetical protein
LTYDNTYICHIEQLNVDYNSIVVVMKFIFMLLFSKRTFFFTS